MVQGRSNKWEWKNCFPNLAISDECVNIMNSEKNKINNGKTKDENVKNEKGDVEHIFWDAVKICKKECKDLDPDCRSFNIKNGTNRGYVCEYSRAVLSYKTCKYDGTKTTFFETKGSNTECLQNKGCGLNLEHCDQHSFPTDSWDCCTIDEDEY